ncbi:hypothetical protein HUE58_02505 [Candidatus Ruthia endofausta]|uniref:Uncharacterized protein n=1 Tax=Candidatus Ruthia endofausta TaxID=2738852 RepID=A0A6N0HNT4_9GAMM|nr:hypothetical protein [Candidatus Ruthia endofausta]QKQ24049.1 hypothetical protein HUE58_02505 [Candidatus Ruthia endofausta]
MISPNQNNTYPITPFYAQDLECFLWQAGLVSVFSMLLWSVFSHIDIN